MKAHTESKEQQIILSIGMIVKNEEKVLERCLKSLQPLMKAIPSELIIADTGSTDSTVEIAKKYTDNVYHFEWINDFAAARNSTLEKAKGKWYFFLDADEYLDEDIREIVEFFRIPELYNHYKCAQIVLRNYLDPNFKTQSTAMLPRFHRIAECEEKVEFIGAIHETIIMRNPLGYFQTILNHTGYAFSSTTQKQKKFDRNLALMKEEYNETEPHNRFRIICHLIDCLMEKPEEAEVYIKEGLKLSRNDKFRFFSRSLFLQAIRYYFRYNILYALDLCDEYFELYPESSKYVATVGIMQKKADILYNLGKYEEAYQTYLRYFELYKDYKNDKLDISDASAHNVNGLLETEYIQSKILAINCLVNLFEYDKAFKMAEEFNFNDLKDEYYVSVVSILQKICHKSKKYKKLAECYQSFLETNDSNKISIALTALEKTFYSCIAQEEKNEFADQIVKSNVEGHYINLMKLYLDQENLNFISELKSFLDSIEDWSVGYTEAVFLAVKFKLDISDLVMKMKSDVFCNKLNLIANTHDDFAKHVLDYGVPEKLLSNIKLFYWLVVMYEVAVYRSFELSEKEKYELYLRFTTLLGEYVSNIYNPELMEDENDLEVIPSLHRFGYYMLKANTYLNNGDSVNYIREMKIALQNCEGMKKMVEFMLEQFKKLMGMQ